MNALGGIPLLRRLFGRDVVAPADPTLAVCRAHGSKAAIVFVHGFQGGVQDTWSCFTEQLLGDPDLADWDAYSLGFASRLSLDLPIWEADPGILLCARSMATKLRSSALAHYECVAIVAHSMGGLVAQRAVLDTDLLDGRLSHLMLFGTPSGGLTKAGLGRLLKLQLRDMASEAPFITRLRNDWQAQVGEGPTFGFRTVAGESDAFVPASSSLEPFAVEHQEAVPGNHVEIVRPRSRSDPSYDLFKRVMRGDLAAHSASETARLAVERKDFKRAIGLLEPGFAQLDVNAVVTLALALESEGRSARALEILDVWGASRRETDPKGVLAGRLKRRWLLERQQSDLDRALTLYRDGLGAATAAGDHGQAHYHAINVAYLLVASARDDEAVPQAALDAAAEAAAQSALAPPSAWRTATQAEAKLILGDLNGAVLDYSSAAGEARTLRDRHSMYLQATALAARVHGKAGREQIDAAFGILPPSRS
jgi:pimeloyl-ACP methyl ester carboxylesterase